MALSLRRSWGRFALCGVLLGSGASGQSDTGQAREIFRAGLALEAAGDWAGALVKFRQVAEARPTPQVRFHIARCQEFLGRWTEALGTYRLALGEAEALQIEEVLREGNRARIALEERIPRLTLVRGAGVESAVIFVDGVEMGASVTEAPLVLDPGPHVIEAKVIQQERLEPLLRREVVLVEKERQTLSLEASRPAATGSDPAAAHPVGPESFQEKTAAGPRRSRGPAVVLLGVGAALGTASILLWARRQEALSELDSSCAGSRCPPAMEPVARQGQRSAWLSLGTGLGAAAALGTGAWLLLRPEATPTTVQRPGSSVVAGVSGSGPVVAWRGVF